MLSNSLQEEMLEIIGSGELSLEDLVAEMEDRHPEVSTFEIRSAILPMWSSGEIQVNDGIICACPD